MSFFSELKRRKVVRTTLLYVALGWGAIEVFSTLGQIFAWPDLISRGLVIAVVLGLPVAIGISWWFDLTPDGLIPTDDVLASPGADSPAQDSTASVTQDGPARISVPPPTPATRLLGRDDPLEAASEHLRSGARLLTVTGTGGTGKTRFAVALFDRLHRDYPAGSAFVSLASVEDAADVFPTVASALAIAEAHGRSAVGAVATVIGGERVLLVLDNLEQVLDCASEVAELVSECPGLQVVATSRAPLKIAAEVELALPPLALPATDDTAPEDLTLYPAIQLFVERANKVKPDFALTGDNAEAVVGICRRLDGLPLALELAAARIRILSPEALLARLDQTLDVLTTGDRDLPERQRTLRATVEWSYDLLDEGERRLLRFLSVFSDGWTLEAMESVCYVESNRGRALDELESLVEKGLVQLSVADDRYIMLVTIRSFAADRLADAGETAEANRRHADYFVEHARGVHHGITGTEQIPAMARARIESANTTAALEWLTTEASGGNGDSLEKALSLAGYLNWVWHITGLHLTARKAVDDVLALAKDRPPSLGRSLAYSTAGMVSISTGEMERGLDEWRRAFDDGIAVGDQHAIAQAQVGIGFTMVPLGLVDEARQTFEDCAERSAEHGEPFFAAVVEGFLGSVDGVVGELESGMARMERSIRLSEEIGDYECRGVTTSFLAQFHYMKGDAVTALAYYEKALELLGTVGDYPELARAHGEMGWAALALDRYDEARQAFLRSLRWYDEVGSPRGKGTALTGLAVVEAKAGDAARALTIAGAADVMAEQAGVVIEHAMTLGAEDQIDVLRAAYDPEVLASLTGTGRAMSPAEILALVTRAGEAELAVAK